MIEHKKQLVKQKLADGKTIEKVFESLHDVSRKLDVGRVIDVQALSNV